MAYSSGKISAPVSIYDVQQALGTNECDLGSLCRHASINMWAKYKPVVRVNKLDTTDQLLANLTWKPLSQISPQSSAWFKSDAGNYGITPRSFSIGTAQNRTIAALNNLAAVVAASTDGLNGWTYTRPQGNSVNPVEPFRQIDFNQYYATAPRPVTKATISESNVSASYTSVWQISLDVMGSAWNDIADSIDDRDYLRLSDILPTSYFGIAIFRLVNNTYEAMAWCTGNIWYGVGVQTSGEGVTPGDNNVGATFVDGHTYYVLPVLFAEQLPQTDGNGNTLYGYSKQTRLTSGDNDHMWSIPHTTFIPFTTSWRSTSQAIALPRVNPNEIGLSGGSGYYNGLVQLDSTVAGYVGSGGRSVTASYALVTGAWRGSLSNMSAGEYVPGSVGNWTGAVAANTLTTIGNFSGTRALTGLSLQESYRWIISLEGEMTPIALRQPYIPST